MQRPCKQTTRTAAEPAKRSRASYQERLQAEHAFVHEGLSLADIAKGHARAYATIKEWHDAGEWDKARKAFLISKAGAADIIERKFQQLLMQIEGSEAMISGAQADTVLKVAKAVDMLRGDRYTALQAFMFFKDFAQYLRAAQPDLLPLLEPHVERFLQDLRKTLLAREP
jgi:hypothetical protein